MKRMLFVFVWLLLVGVVPSDASQRPVAFFSQEVLPYNANGESFGAVTIDPSRFSGMQELSFPLGPGNDLLIKTNLVDPGARGLDNLVATIRRCYDFVETTAGRRPPGDFLLYLLELDYIPRFYRFQAAFDSDAARWGEVRLAMVEKGQPLAGLGSSAELQELMYDTLPHELGHDLLTSLTPLQQDIDGQPSHHVRWFVEGVCEVLAKGFARQETPSLLHYFLGKRNVDRVLQSPAIRQQLFGWTQENANPMELESDLYGASLLVLLRWTETTPLADLLDRIARHHEPVTGGTLLAMMEDTTAMTHVQMLTSASQLGRSLAVPRL